MTPDTFNEWSRNAPERLIEWIYPIAIQSAEDAVPGLEEGEYQDAFTKRIPSFVKGMDGYSPAQWTNFVKRGVFWGALDIAIKRGIRIEREMSLEDSYDEIAENRQRSHSEVLKAESLLAKKILLQEELAVEAREIRGELFRIMKPSERRLFELIEQLEKGEVRVEEICRDLELGYDAYCVRRSRLMKKVREVIVRHQTLD